VKSYKFRQASDFWYLTGFDEPDSALVLGKSHSTNTLRGHVRVCIIHAYIRFDLLSRPTEKNSSPRGFRMILYSTGTDPSKEKWDGASTRFADVISLFGADDARPLDNLADDLRALVARAEHLYVDLPGPNRHTRYHHRRRVVGAGTLPGTKFPFFKKYLSRHSDGDDHAAETGGSYMDVIASSMSMSKRKPLAPLVGALRSVKSACEVEVMKASAEISGRAHAKVSFMFQKEWFY
jgi:intermediate cleaving peptidase 55